MQKLHVIRDQAPAGIVVDDFGPELVLVRRWFVPFPWHAVSFAVFWNLFVVFWYTLVLLSTAAEAPRVPMWVLRVFCIPHAIVGLCLLYVAVCRLVNQTRIVVTRERLTVRHGPLPLCCSRMFAAGGIQQVFCVERKATSRRDFPPKTFELLVWNRDDSCDILLSGMEDLPQAQFLERRIEQYLGLSKERVPPGFSPLPITATPS